jgi:multiple sugar transport system substrate-binding protein
MTNDVQIAYSQTEGYVPVTHKAQNSDEYKDYMSRAGEDDELYYDVKIAAAQILVDHVDNTFVTPVFSGSSSVRDAAGQLIEEVVKAKRRNKKVDDAFIDNLFDEMTALYHLDQVSPVETWEESTELVTENETELFSTSD